MEPRPQEPTEPEGKFVIGWELNFRDNSEGFENLIQAITSSHTASISSVPISSAPVSQCGINYEGIVYNVLSAKNNAITIYSSGGKDDARKLKRKFGAKSIKRIKLRSLTYVDKPNVFTSIQSLLDNERSGVLGYNNYGMQPDINEKMRAILVDWLIEVAKMFKLLPITFYVAINIVDAYLSREQVTRDILQLVGLSSMSLAAKYNEIFPPENADYVFISDKTYTKDQILEMEKKIFITLGCNINVPNDIEYHRVISTLSQSSGEAHTTGTNLLRAVRLDIKIQYLPSVIVTAIKYITGELYGEKYVNCFKIPEDVILSCVADIISLCKRLNKSSLMAWRKISGFQTDVWKNTFDRICALPVPQFAAGDFSEYRPLTYFKADIKIPLIPVENAVKLQKLGEGSFGDVIKMSYNGTEYAVKKTKMEFLDNDPLTQGFLREVTMLRFLQHPNIIKMQYLGDKLRRIFLPLGQSDVKNWLDKNGAMDFSLQKQFAEQMYSALSYMHSQGCLHRDIKPQNIIVFEENGNLVFRLSDLGSARGGQIALRSEAFTHEICTIWYRSPDILLGSKSYDDGLDIWSMACTLYECAHGTALFPGDSEIDMLMKIFHILGTPTENEWPGVTSLSEYRPDFPRWKPNATFFTDNKKLAPVTQKIIVVSLVLDPAKRQTSDVISLIAQKF